MMEIGKRLKNRLIFVLFTTILLLIPSYGLRSQIKVPFWEAGLSSVGGLGKQAPFWIVSNRQGKFLPEKYAAAMELGLFVEQDTGRVIDYDYGLEMYGRLGTTSDMWVHQAYLNMKIWDMVKVSAGWQEETVGSSEPSISTGSVIWSGNARPMPKIAIGTPGYVPVPFTRGYAEISGTLSHGWFEEGRYASNVWLHHKNFYIRLGGTLPVNIHYGFNHYAQWGGSSPRQEDPYPSDFKSYMKVFFISDGDPDQAGTPDGWVINKFGNHLGSRNYGIDLNLGTVSAGIYHQDVFEDNSGYSRKNFPDGLWGARIRLPDQGRIVQAVVYEFLHTTDQSGPVHDVEGDTLGGNDNYFNHGHYQSGWTYHKYTIGTPMVTSPLLNDPANYRIRNNRVIAHHLGFEGFIGVNLRYRTLFTFSRNFGTYTWPFDERRDQLSWMAEFTGPLNVFDLEAGVTVAGDTGRMYGDNFGIILVLRKRGSF